MNKLTPDKVNKVFEDDVLLEYLVRFFWARVMWEESGCLIWRGARTVKEYGQIKTSYRDNKVNIYAHRFAWVLHCGAIPDDLGVLHDCDNPPCVNHRHLFLGTNADNTRDMVYKGRSRGRYSGLSHCTKGHEYTLKNTRVDSRGRRVCRTCARDRERVYRARKANL